MNGGPSIHLCLEYPPNLNAPRMFSGNLLGIRGAQPSPVPATSTTGELGTRSPVDCRASMELDTADATSIMGSPTGPDQLAPAPEA